MSYLRYGLPLAIFLLACALLIIDGGGQIGWEAFLMGTGAALAVLLLNWLFRLGVEGDRERDAEEAAREYMARTGHWPDEEGG
jgi:ABC-type transport system involved in cytochrome bd biosynthesis fused ATPase/permease subunit